MRVAVVGLRGLDASLGGIEAALVEILPRMEKLGVHFTVYCRDRFFDGNFSPSGGIQIVSVPTLYFPGTETLIYSLLSQPNKSNVDLVHFHALGPSLCAPIARARGFKVVSTVHGLDWQRPKWGQVAKTALRVGEWTAARAPHATITVSRALERHFVRHYPRSRITYIPNGISERPFRGLERLKQFGVQSKKFVLFLGRLVPDKGVDLLLRAYEQLPIELRQVPLLMAGDDSGNTQYIRYLKQLAREMPTAIFTGTLRGIEKEEALDHALLLVLPSRIEGLSVALLEAMSRGSCPLVSDIDANREVLEDEDGRRAGYTFRSESVPDLTEQLHGAMMRREETMALGDMARQHVVRTYSWDKAALDTVALYQRLLE